MRFDAVSSEDWQLCALGDCLQAASIAETAAGWLVREDGQGLGLLGRLSLLGSIYNGVCFIYNRGIYTLAI